MPIAEIIGLSGKLGLWTLGKPYIIPGREPIGLSSLLKGIWQYIFLLFHCKELLKLYVNLLYRFCVTILFLEIF